MGEDVVEGVLWSDLTACDVGKVIEAGTEILGNEVAAELGVKTVEDTEQIVVGTAQCVVVTGIRHDDIVLREVGQVGQLIELCAQIVDAYILFG